MTDVTNYWAISLLNVIGKILSYILNLRLKAWCDANDLQPEEQAKTRLEADFIPYTLILKFISIA